MSEERQACLQCGSVVYCAVGNHGCNECRPETTCIGCGAEVDGKGLGPGTRVCPLCECLINGRPWFIIGDHTKELV